MDAYVIVLRIVHILAGAFWVGATAMIFLFIQPSARELGPEGGRFMLHLAIRKRVTTIVLWAAGLNVAAGLLLYWRSSDGLRTAWITSAPGLTFSVGGLAAIAAFSIGLSTVRPTVRTIAALGQAIAGSGGPPTPEQAQELQGLQRRMAAAGKVVLVLLTVAVVGMASARYL